MINVSASFSSSTPNVFTPLSMDLRTSSATELASAEDELGDRKARELVLRKAISPSAGPRALDRSDAARQVLTDDDIVSTAFLVDSVGPARDQVPAALVHRPGAAVVDRVVPCVPDVLATDEGIPLGNQVGGNGWLPGSSRQNEFMTIGDVRPLDSAIHRSLAVVEGRKLYRDGRMDKAIVHAFEECDRSPRPLEPLHVEQDAESDEKDRQGDHCGQKQLAAEAQLPRFVRDRGFPSVRHCPPRCYQRAVTGFARRSRERKGTVSQLPEASF